MRKHKCILCGFAFIDPAHFAKCPQCGSVGTTVSTEHSQEFLDNIAKIFNKEQDNAQS